MTINIFIRALDFTEIIKKEGILSSELNCHYSSFLRGLSMNMTNLDAEIAIENKDLMIGGLNSENNISVYRRDLCEKFSKLMRHLPAAIDPKDLNYYIALLSAYPSLEILNVVGQFVNSPDKRLDNKRLSRIERILENMQNNEVLNTCAGQEAPIGYRFEIIPMGGDYRTLQHMMNKIPNCIKAEEKESIAKHIQEDIDLGACIKVFGVDMSGEPQMYLRNYVTIDYKGNPVIEIDAVEGGEETYWTTVQQWADAQRGKELIYGIATSFYIAQFLGIRHVALGEFESDEIGHMIGCRETRVFDSDVRKRKIGLSPRLVDENEAVAEEGVFVNRLSNGSYQRLLDLSYGELVKGYKGILSSEISQDPSANGNRWKQHPIKQREIIAYNQALRLFSKSLGILESTN